MLRATHGTRVEEMTGRPRMRPGEGITGTAAAAARAGDDRGAGAPGRALQGVPEPARGRVRVDPRRADPGAREAGGRAERPHPRAARVLAAPRSSCWLAIASQVAQTIEHAKLYAQAQRRVVELEALARISEAVSESLYLEESLEGIVAATVDALGATGAALVLEDGEVVWPDGPRRRARGAGAAALEGPADRRAGLRPRHAVHARRPRAARARSRATPRSRSSTAAR